MMFLHVSSRRPSAAKAGGHLDPRTTRTSDSHPSYRTRQVYVNKQKDRHLYPVMSSALVIERNLPVPMRDGTILRADVYRPAVDQPVPAVLCRVPYDISQPLVPLSGLDPERAAQAGLAYVCQTTRGRYESQGRFYPFVHEGADGY